MRSGDPRRTSPLTRLVALAVCAAAGCSGQPEVSPPAPPAPPPALPIVAPGTESPQTPAASPAEAEKLATAEAAWRPPFPNRADLFEPPRFVGRVARSDQAGSAESVVLMGFANIDKPIALLEIDGAPTPLAEREEREGVAVIEISPPRVVLQRGRTRWTASLE